MVEDMPKYIYRKEIPGMESLFYAFDFEGVLEFGRSKPVAKLIK